MNTMVANSTATVAVDVFSKPRRVKINAITAVANTSKKPSTHRCPSHQRQYSTSEIWVCSPHIRAEAKNRPMPPADRTSRTAQRRASLALHSAQVGRGAGREGG